MTTIHDGIEQGREGLTLKRVGLLLGAILASAALTCTLAATASANEPVGFFLEGSESEDEGEQPRFAAESYPVYLEGHGGVHTWKFQPGNIACPIDFFNQYEVPLEEATSSLTLTTFVSYFDCETPYGSLTITANGCDDTLDVLNAGPPYVGQWGKCPAEGTGPYRFILSGIFGTCTVSIPQQSGLEAVDYKNTGEGAERGVEVDLNVTGLKYSIEGPSFCEPGEYENGTYSGTVTLGGLTEQPIH